MNLMKKQIFSATVCMLIAFPAFAAETATPTPPAVSVELEKMKSLSGNWEGMSKSSHESQQLASAQYKVTAGGSAVVETLFPGTSHEMVSVYHDEGGELVVTHYCMLGNQPKLKLKSAEDGHFVFELTKESSEALAGQMHMHSLDLEWKKDGGLIQTWTAEDGKGGLMSSTVIALNKTLNEYTA